MALTASQAAKNAASEILKEIRLPVYPYLTDELAMGTWRENSYRRALTRARWAELIAKMDVSPIELSAVTPSDVLASALEAIDMTKADFARETGMNLSNISMVLSDHHWLRGIREKMTAELFVRLPEQTKSKEIRFDRHAFFRECAEDILSDEWEMGSSWKIRRALDAHLRAISSDPELASDAIVLSSVMRDGFTRDIAVAGWHNEVVRVEKINGAPCILVHVNNIEDARAFFSTEGAFSNHYYGEIGSSSDMDALLDVPIFLWMDGLVYGIHPQTNRLLSYPFSSAKESVLNHLRKKKFPDGIVAAIEEQRKNPSAYQEETFTPPTEYKACNSSGESFASVETAPPPVPAQDESLACDPPCDDCQCQPSEPKEKDMVTLACEAADVIEVVKSIALPEMFIRTPAYQEETLTLSAEYKASADHDAETTSDFKPRDANDLAMEAAEKRAQQKKDDFLGRRGGDFTEDSHDDFDVVGPICGSAPDEPEPIAKTTQEVTEQKRRIASRVKTLASRHFNGVIDTAWRSIYDTFFEEFGVDPLYEGKKAKKSGVAYLADSNQLDDFERVIGDVEEAFYKSSR
jgi:hypothetical protein